MKKTVLTFGLISGLMISLLMGGWVWLLGVRDIGRRALHRSLPPSRGRNGVQG